jgi:hypothetical protein
MSREKRRALRLTVYVVIALAGLAVGGSQVGDALRATPETVTVTVTTPAPVETIRPRLREDDPRWNCRTMGNRRCGR